MIFQQFVISITNNIIEKNIYTYPARRFQIYHATVISGELYHYKLLTTLGLNS